MRITTTLLKTTILPLTIGFETMADKAVDDFKATLEADTPDLANQAEEHRAQTIDQLKADCYIFTKLAPHLTWLQHQLELADKRVRRAAERNLKTFNFAEHLDSYFSDDDNLKQIEEMVNLTGYLSHDYIDEVKKAAAMAIDYLNEE